MYAYYIYIYIYSCIIVVKITKIVKFGLVVANIPKSSRKRLQITCCRKWTGYILADFY